MPGSTIRSIPAHEPAQRRTQLRRARDGSLLAVPVLLRCTAGRTPTAIATCLFGSRSRVSRLVHRYRDGTRTCERVEDDAIGPAIRTTSLAPTSRRRLLAWRGKVASLYGWCRTRWRGQTLAVHLKIPRGLEVSASTRRRGWHARDDGWKRAQRGAREDDPERGERLARIRHQGEALGQKAMLLCADALDLPLRPTVGDEWRPTGEVRALVTPGQNRQRDLAGSLDPKAGRSSQVTGERQTHAWCRARLETRAWASPAAAFERGYVVVDHDGSHQAKAVGSWRASPPRVAWLFLPPDGPKANPIERGFGDVHDTCTRHHRRRRMEDLVLDVERHVNVNGPWSYTRSDISDTPEITAAVQSMSAEKTSEVAA